MDNFNGSVFLANLHYFFAKTDDSYDLPNSSVGDLLKQAQKEIGSHAGKVQDAAANIELLGHRCADGGKCHHQCESVCFRKDGCAPLSACSWLNEDWSTKT